MQRYGKPGNSTLINTIKTNGLKRKRQSIPRCSPSKKKQDRIDQKVRDAEKYVAQRKREGTLKWSDKPGAYGDQNQIDGIYTGPRGGKYRVNSNGRKSYDVP